MTTLGNSIPIETPTNVNATGCPSKSDSAAGAESVMEAVTSNAKEGCSFAVSKKLTNMPAEVIFSLNNFNEKNDGKHISDLLFIDTY